MSELAEKTDPALWRRFMAWARRSGLGNKLAITLAIAAIVSGIATYSALTAASPFSPDPRTVLRLLLINLGLLLILGAVVGRRLVKLWVARRAGSAGSRLHVRMAGLFAMVAVVPTIMVGVFSSLFFNLGLEAWFSDKVRTVLQESALVAAAYLEEHKKVIRADILAMANDLNRLAPDLALKRVGLNEVVVAQAALRSLPEAIVFNSSGQVLARSQFSFGVSLDSLPSGALEQASRGDVIIMASDTDNRLRGLIRLDRYIDAFLYVGRFLDSRVLSHAARAGDAVAEYERLEGARSGIEITFTMIFMVVGLLILFAAMWFGLWFANRLVSPVGRLVTAVERVREGDLSVRVREEDSDDEIAMLGRAFNRMTGQLEAQSSDLKDANRQLNERRRFTEAVLSGVTAGVLGLDRDGVINLPNRSATKLLDTPEKNLVGRPLEDALPEMAHLLGQARKRRGKVAQDQIVINRGGASRTLLVRMVAEWSRKGVSGYVVTFDDVTDLMVAQRRAAWADVARRIAHEIKNPLTPIQLSAERLRRKYAKEVKSDPDIFGKCTETIIRQVGDIGRMVDEFSSFARMPAPVFKDEDMGELVSQSLFLQKVANPDIEFEASIPEEPIKLSCDGQQVSRVLTNLLKNAAESIENRVKPKHGELPAGRAKIRVREENGDVYIEIEDNGPGFPAGQRARLTEPYVTTRAKGSGLGLAIAMKVMEEHRGDLNLLDAPGGGALVQMVFPRDAAGGRATDLKAGPGEGRLSHAS